MTRRGKMGGEERGRSRGRRQGTPCSPSQISGDKREKIVFKIHVKIQIV